MRVLRRLIIERIAALKDPEVVENLLADTIGRGPERPIFDMPGDSMRYTRDASGIDTVIVNGQVAWTKAGYTDVKSGEICAFG